MSRRLTLRLLSPTIDPKMPQLLGDKCKSTEEVTISSSDYLEMTTAIDSVKACSFI
jgi:hypothetical protein